MKVIKTTYQSSSSKNNEIIKLTNEIKNAFQKIEEKKNKTVNQYLSSIQSIKKEYQRDVNENNHWKKRNEQLEHIIKEERKKQNKSLKVKHTESSGSEDGYNYYRKKPSKQRKNKQKYYDYEYCNDEDYSNGPRVTQNKRKNNYYEEEDDGNSQNKKDTKKRRSQQEEHEDYSDGNNEETSDNDIDKTNKKNTI